MPLKYVTVRSVLGVFSVGALSVSIYILISSHLTSSWPSTEGHIIYTDARNLGASTGPKGPVLSVTVDKAMYSYTVDYYEYYGHAAINSEMTKLSKHSLEVYYNPNNPAQSILYNGINWPFTAGFAFLGALFAYVAYSWRKP